MRAARVTTGAKTRRGAWVRPWIPTTTLAAWRPAACGAIRRFYVFGYRIHQATPASCCIEGPGDPDHSLLGQLLWAERGSERRDQASVLLSLPAIASDFALSSPLRRGGFEPGSGDEITSGNESQCPSFEGAHQLVVVVELATGGGSGAEGDCGSSEIPLDQGEMAEFDLDCGFSPSLAELAERVEQSVAHARAPVSLPRTRSTCDISRSR